MKLISKNLFIVLVSLAILISSSCTNLEKTLKIAAFNKFITEVSDGYKTYTKEDWQKTDDKFKKYCVYFESERIYKILSPEEKKEVANLKGKYAGMRFKSKTKEKVNKVFDWLDEKGRYIEGVFEGVEN